MTVWTRGDDSVVYRFEEYHDNGALLRTVEIEEHDSGEADVRLIEPPGKLPSMTKRMESLDAASNFVREEWDIDGDVLPDSPTVRVKRLVLSELANYVGTLVTFGQDIPQEKRDALAAAYEALDEPGIPLTFHDCPTDGASLDKLPRDPNLPDHIVSLECPECGQEYLLDRDRGELEPTGN